MKTSVLVAIAAFIFGLSMPLHASSFVVSGGKVHISGGDDKVRIGFSYHFGSSPKYHHRSYRHPRYHGYSHDYYPYSYHPHHDKYAPNYRRYYPHKKYYKHDYPPKIIYRKQGCVKTYTSAPSNNSSSQGPSRIRVKPKYHCK